MSIAVGLVGAGVMGSEHGRILSRDTPHAHLAGIYDLDENKARNTGARRLFKDPLELIHSKEIDALLIASPDATHADLVLACIEIGKPVLCEKPLAMTSEQTGAIVDAESKLGRRVVQVGYMRRFDRGYRELKSHFDAGVIGNPEILHNIHRNPVAPEWMTGNMLITNAFVHEIDIARWLLRSELESVTVTASEKGDPMIVTARMANGAIVSTELYMNCKFGYQVQAELVGSEGTISLPAHSSVTVAKSGEHSSLIPGNWIPRFRDAYTAQTIEWVKSISSGEPNIGATAWDGHMTTLIAEQLVARTSPNQTVNISAQKRPELYV